MTYEITGLEKREWKNKTNRLYVDFNGYNLCFLQKVNKNKGMGEKTVERLISNEILFPVLERHNYTIKDLIGKRCIIKRNRVYILEFDLAEPS